LQWRILCETEIAFDEAIIGIAMPSLTVLKRISGVLTLLTVLAACAGPDVVGGIFDPFEAQNRKTHAFNRKFDQVLLRPISGTYGEILPEPLRIGVGNFASNLSIPGSVVNDLLQFNLQDALHNTVRFLVNTTFGLGGIMDLALQGGVEPRDSDFGETLHVWGIGEGAYVEWPLFGPSTVRDTFGGVVDLFLDPINTLVPAPERYLAPVVAAASRIGDRYRFRSTVDSILYDSADSYAQSRLLYLENRRFRLGIEADDEDLYDGLYDDFIVE